MTKITSLALILGLAACEGTGVQMAPVEALLTAETASAAASADVASAQVWVSRGYLVPGDSNGFVTVFDTPQQFDLLDLANGVTTALGGALVPVGTYAQFRLVVDSAQLTLGGGVTFEDGSTTKTLFVPSGMQTGIKVVFPGGLNVDGATAIVVTFDVLQNFHFQGPPAGPKSVLFTPTLKATVS